MPDRVAIIGECMLELTHAPGGEHGSRLPMLMSYGGDTLNTAIYMARLGVAVDYVTALGDDKLSDWMIAEWRKEGVGGALVDQQANSVPGLYLIELDEQGERSFHYWRDSAPAKRLFDEQDKAASLFAKLGAYQWLCLSGISLAILSDAGRQHLFDGLVDYRRGGGKVVFDGNYRPSLWTNLKLAQQACETMYRLADIALPTLDDEQQLFGDVSANAVVERLTGWGVDEIVLKMGSQGCLLAHKGQHTTVQAHKVDVVDTTAAGDSFNAAYVAARMTDTTPAQAAAMGHQLASTVIQHRGAIIPASQMP